jgi:hypothetical protein
MPAEERAGIAVGRRQETIVCPTALGKAQASGAVEPLVPARKHFSDTISLNPDMAESERAKKYIAKIDALLPSGN